MIYTSSFDNVKNLKDLGYLNFISIAGNTPEWFEQNIKKYNHYYKFQELAPKYTWWKDWNDGKLSNDDYIKLYKETVLDKINVKELKEKLQKIYNPVFLCYENSFEFCHRHIFAKWWQEQLEKHFNIIDDVEEVLIPNTWIYAVVTESYGDEEVISLHKSFESAKIKLENYVKNYINDMKIHFNVEKIDIQKIDDLTYLERYYREDDGTYFKIVRKGLFD